MRLQPWEQGASYEKCTVVLKLGNLRGCLALEQARCSEVGRSLTLEALESVSP